ncbi:hypothetical protein BC628DRAFT_374486 [Trametes gibbosa]|uniref:Zinc finger protein 222 n=1 Tax=Trametes gibbosa TaxID=160864 RepID=A0A6B9KR48_9APHY|nr:hypothetical protein BC628DRAFT_374486 [Trametes gibbosa]QHA24595.1 zinc finger protein 222 [Trametes gibbosa]
MCVESWHTMTSLPCKACHIHLPSAQALHMHMREVHYFCRACGTHFESSKDIGEVGAWSVSISLCSCVPQHRLLSGCALAQPIRDPAVGGSRAGAASEAYTERAHDQPTRDPSAGPSRASKSPPDDWSQEKTGMRLLPPGDTNAPTGQVAIEVPLAASADQYSKDFLRDTSL